MKYDYDRSFEFKLNEDNWEAYLVTEQELEELAEEFELEEPEAIVALDTKCLFLKEDCVNKQILGHELYHIYVDYFNIGSANLDADQFEEVNADFIGNHIDKFIKIRDDLFLKFQGLI